MVSEGSGLWERDELWGSVLAFGCCDAGALETVLGTERVVDGEVRRAMPLYGTYWVAVRLLPTPPATLFRSCTGRSRDSGCCQGNVIARLPAFAVCGTLLRIVTCASATCRLRIDAVRPSKVAISSSRVIPLDSVLVLRATARPTPRRRSSSSRTQCDATGSYEDRRIGSCRTWTGLQGRGQIRTGSAFRPREREGRSQRSEAAPMEVYVVSASTSNQSWPATKTPTQQAPERLAASSDDPVDERASCNEKTSYRPAHRA